MKRLRVFLFRAAPATFAALAALASPAATAQALPGVVPGTAEGGYHIVSPAVQPTLSPGQLQLLELEARFAESVKTGGGKAFATWFAEDAVALNNGKPAILGRGAIALGANWDPAQYQLTWLPQGAQMGPSNDMGFTWGHYEGHSKDHNGQPILTEGRYMTVWKKTADGSWKVALDASADDVPGAGECCALPKP